MAEQFCLRWNNHQSTLISVFENLLESGTLIDCMLYAEGQILKAHKVVLSACSPCFEQMLCAAEDKNPIIFLKDVKFQELKAMLDYMYRGEVNISQDQLDSFLKTAEALQIKGLTDQGGGGGAPGGGGGVGVGSSEVGEPPAKKGPGRKTGVSDVAPESPLVGNAPLREGSVSPGGTKRRRRVARRPSADETSADNSCDIPPVAAAAQPQPQQISASPQATSTPQDSARFVVKKQEAMDPPTTSQHNMIQPKTEFIEETNEDIEDLTLDDDDDYSEMSKPGTSFGTIPPPNNSSQDFSQWQMMGGDRTQTDEVFMAAQEAINNQSNTQGQRCRRPCYNCKGCEKRFTSSESLARHIIDCMYLESIYNCSKCEYKTSRLKSYKEHLLQEHGILLEMNKNNNKHSGNLHQHKSVDFFKYANSCYSIKKVSPTTSPSLVANIKLPSKKPDTTLKIDPQEFEVILTDNNRNHNISSTYNISKDCVDKLSAMSGTTPAATTITSEISVPNQIVDKQKSSDVNVQSPETLIECPYCSDFTSYYRHLIFRHCRILHGHNEEEVNNEFVRKGLTPV